MGVSSDRLVFSWTCPEIAATARQVSLALADDTEAAVWDSGRVAGGAPMLAYGGPPLLARRDYAWRVRLWDAHGSPSPWSEPAFFDTVPTEADFTGGWVSMPGMLTPLFRSRFELDDPAAVTRARWYIACGGLVEPRLNGRKLGEQVLFPDHTDYATITTVASFDALPHLRRGENVLGVVLGGGWFAHHLYGERCFLSQLELTLRDGTRRVLATMPGDWQARPGPWLAEDVIHGEWYDARLEPAGWDTPGHEPDAAWHTLGHSYGRPVPNAGEPPGGKLTPPHAPPTRVIRDVLPVSARPAGGGRLVLDFGAAFTGWLRVSGRAPAGTPLVIRMAEALGSDGLVDPLTNKGARGVNTYSFRGEGLEVWSPRFSYQGFRYAQLESPGQLPADLQVVGQVVHSDCPFRGTFASSHTGLNTLFQMAVRTVESNLFGLLHDCPQRDERQGWLADAYAATPMVLTWFDAAALYRKWMADMAAVQDQVTHLRWSSTAPPSPKYASRPPRNRSRHRMHEALRDVPQADSVYTAACTIIPWQYYQATGEPGHLEHYYPLIAQHLRAMARREDFPILQSSWHGDHAAMGWTMSPPAEKTPSDLVASAVFLRELRIAADMARVLGRQGDATEWEALAERSARAIAGRFFDERAGSFGSQGADGMALDLEFAPPGQRDRVAQALAADLQARGNHLTSGVVTTPCVLRALSETGHHQLAFDAIMAAGEPGFLWWVEHGFTTFAEHIVSNWPDTSRNQPAWILIFDWVIRHVAGIRPAAPGYERVTFAPHLPHGLDWIDVRIETVRGQIHARAERGAGGAVTSSCKVGPAISVTSAGRGPCDTAARHPG